MAYTIYRNSVSFDRVSGNELNMTITLRVLDNGRRGVRNEPVHLWVAKDLYGDRAKREAETDSSGNLIVQVRLGVAGLPKTLPVLVVLPNQQGVSQVYREVVPDRYLKPADALKSTAELQQADELRGRRHRVAIRRTEIEEAEIDRDLRKLRDPQTGVGERILGEARRRRDVAQARVEEVELDQRLASLRQPKSNAEKILEQRRANRTENRADAEAERDVAQAILQRRTAEEATRRLTAGPTPTEAAAQRRSERRAEAELTRDIENIGLTVLESQKKARGLEEEARLDAAPYRLIFTHLGINQDDEDRFHVLYTARLFNHHKQEVTDEVVDLHADMPFWLNINDEGFGTDPLRRHRVRFRGEPMLCEVVNNSTERPLRVDAHVVGHQISILDRPWVPRRRHRYVITHAGARIATMAVLCLLSLLFLAGAVSQPPVVPFVATLEEKANDPRVTEFYSLQQPEIGLDRKTQNRPPIAHEEVAKRSAIPYMTLFLVSLPFNLLLFLALFGRFIIEQFRRGYENYRSSGSGSYRRGDFSDRVSELTESSAAKTITAATGLVSGESKPTTQPTQPAPTGTSAIGRLAEVAAVDVFMEGVYKFIKPLFGRRTKDN